MRKMPLAYRHGIKPDSSQYIKDFKFIALRHEIIAQMAKRIMTAIGQGRPD
jgi:hypothetical protein